ncbi:MAG: hypothetical protein LBR22_05340 [Desulfovibrio sp.]|jgi:tetratricopeptide (TPR) repeat protein|nr:hypothetical protein [Desulfovibrio sp.]
MPKFATLLSRMPQTKDVQMSTSGHVLWLAWQGTLSPAVPKTLAGYGGMDICGDDDQSVWFFFTNDVFLALARLTIWGNFNALPLTVQLFPGRLLLSSKQAASIDIDATLRNQEILVGENLEVWVHPKSRENVQAMAGISFESRAARQGMCAVDWLTMLVDARMPYSSTQAWFALIHPLGSPLDKAFQSGWEESFKVIDEILRANKIKFLIHEYFLMVSLENLLMLRTFLRDYLRAFDREEGEVWPCVCVVADRNNLNFTIDLPKKIGMQWDKLMPGFPYISYRNAYLLGSDFVVQDLRYSHSDAGMDSWCNVLLGEGASSIHSLPLRMASKLTEQGEGGWECFYCGIGSHTAAECPTRRMRPSPEDIWERVGELDIETINENFRDIEDAITIDGVEGMNGILSKGAPSATLLEAIMDITPICQLRHVARHWLNKTQNMDLALEDIARDESPAWELLDRLTAASPEDLSDLETRIGHAVQRYPRDQRLRLLQGFCCVERKDFTRAESCFREAATLASMTPHQAWCEYLQARLDEVEGRYAQAIERYTQVRRIMPQWVDVQYRALVCRVKMGFGEQVLEQFEQMILKDPHCFNRILIDPGLERGRLLVLSMLHGLWSKASEGLEDQKASLDELDKRMQSWFAEGTAERDTLGGHMEEVKRLSVTQNYIAFLRVGDAQQEIRKEVEREIESHVEGLRNRYKRYLDALQDIRDEAAWFPFPSTLKDFSKEFNQCAGYLNWAFACNFGDVEAFTEAKQTLPKLAALLRSLKKRLKVLRMVRDGTLFGLTLFKTFMWVEVLGLVLCFVGVPLVVFFGDKIYLGWLKSLLGDNQWSIQKVLTVIVTIIALGIAALRSTLAFDRQREMLLSNARAQRERSQQARVEAIRKKRLEEAEMERKAKKQEAEMELRRRLYG